MFYVVFDGYLYWIVERFEMRQTDEILYGPDSYANCELWLEREFVGVE